MRDELSGSTRLPRDVIRHRDAIKAVLALLLLNAMLSFSLWWPTPATSFMRCELRTIRAAAGTAAAIGHRRLPEELPVQQRRELAGLLGRCDVEMSRGWCCACIRL
jgi:hypothetical protein